MSNNQCLRVKLSEVCEIVSGSTPKTSNTTFWDGDIKWITPAEIDSSAIEIYDSIRHITERGRVSAGLQYFPRGTVILSSRAPIGKVAIAGTEMTCNQGFKNLICGEKIHNRYLYFFLKSKTDFLNSLGRGATFKEISKKIVSDVEVPLPPLDKQQHIAHILTVIANLIVQTKEQYKKLEVLAKSRFMEMFGEPGTDPNGWGITTLGKCCELNPRRPKDLRTDVSYSFVAMPSVDNEGHVDASIERPYSEICKGFTYFAENDVLFAKITPCMENGKGGIAKGLKNGVGFGSTEFHVLRPINDVSDPHWLYTITMLHKFRIEAEKVMTGTGGQRRVPINYLDEYRIALPPFSLQNRFASFVQQHDKSKFSCLWALNRIESFHAEGYITQNR